jgi:hypothetical protein
MAFSTRDLHRLAADQNLDTCLWSYRTTDPLEEVSENKYWREASTTVCEGDIIYATSAARKPLQCAQYFVAEAFSQYGHIVLIQLAAAKG